MKLSPRGLACALGLAWGGAMLFMGTVHLMFHPFGAPLLQALASVYPGYNAVPSWPDLLIGTLYGLVDGAAAGLILAWLYNRFARS